MATRSVSILFTDIEGSTAKWSRYGETMGRALRLHDDLADHVFGRHGVVTLKHTGDGSMAVFEAVDQAVGAALDLARAMAGQAWPIPEPLRLRMGIHAGPAESRDGDWFGITVTRAARIAEAANAGQILVSEAAHLAARDLVPNYSATHLGPVELEGLPEPEPVHHLDLLGPPEPPRRRVRGVFLPFHDTPVVGADHVIDEVRKMVAANRLVTLTGVGGVGKTRTAIEVARRHHHEAVFVDLAPVHARGVASAAAAALGASQRDELDPVPAIVASLQTRPVLLVVDNCEHVREAAANLIECILAGCDSRVLATSRQALGIPAERVKLIDPLAPEPAARLFIERASAAGHRHDLDTPGVREIAERLDGLPLAIELAAARTSHLTPREIADRLDERFRLLVGRQGAERQRTLDAVVTWSYDQLDGAEQAALRAASVCVGGFNLLALSAVLEVDDLAAVDLVRSLVETSLVIARQPRSGATRYSLLETVRLYGRARAVDRGELTVLSAAHAAHFRDRVQVDDRAIGLPWVAFYQDRADAELDNHRAAMDWYVEHDDIASLGRMAASTSLIHAYQDIDWSRRYLERPEVAEALSGFDSWLYLAASTVNANSRGDWSAQITWGGQVLAEATEPRVRAVAAGLVAQIVGTRDQPSADRILEEALHDLDPVDGELRAWLRGRFADGPLMRQETHVALGILESLVDSGERFVLLELAKVRHLVGSHHGVEALIGGLEEWARTPYVKAQWAGIAALGAAASGRRAEAISHFAEAAYHLRRAYDPLVVAELLVTASAIAYQDGDHLHAARLLASAAGRARTPGGFALYAHYRSLVRRRLDRDTVRSVRDAVDSSPSDVLASEVARLGAKTKGEG